MLHAEQWIAMPCHAVPRLRYRLDLLQHLDRGLAFALAARRVLVCAMPSADSRNRPAAAGSTAAAETRGEVGACLDWADAHSWLKFDWPSDMHMHTDDLVGSLQRRTDAVTALTGDEQAVGDHVRLPVVGQFQSVCNAPLVWSTMHRVGKDFLPIAFFGYYLKIVEQDYFAKIICLDFGFCYENVIENVFELT